MSFLFEREVKKTLEINYYNPIWQDGLTYSVDMVRLDVRADLQTGQAWFNLLSNREMDFGKVEYYQSFKIYQYRHLLTIELDDCSSSVTMGFQLNSDKKNDSFKGFIEFNPNKIGCSKFYEWLLDQIKIQFKEVHIKRWDMAIDIPFPRDMVSIHKDNRRYERIESMDGFTEYLGRRSNDGYVKLYDKTKESQLEIPLTRLEITIEGLKPYELLNMPDVYIMCLDGNMDDLNDTERVLVELIRKDGDVDYWVRRLGRKLSQKIKPYLLGVDKAINVSNKTYNDILQQLVLYQHNYIK